MFRTCACCERAEELHCEVQRTVHMRFRDECERFFSWKVQRTVHMCFRDDHKTFFYCEVQCTEHVHLCARTLCCTLMNLSRLTSLGQNRTVQIWPSEVAKPGCYLHLLECGEALRDVTCSMREPAI